MPGFVDSAFEGTLTIASFSMNRAAWAVLGDETGEGGLLQLVTGGDRRGEDRVLPYTAGVVGYPRRLTATRYDLRLLVNGDVDQNGTATADSQTGLGTNLALIRSTLFESATPAADGTLAATVVIPGFGSKAANIHMIGLEQQRYNIDPSAVSREAIWEGTLQISVPGGRFA